MKRESSEVVKKVLDAQSKHWENTLSTRPEMFGVEASAPARYAAEIFKKESQKNILELGAGQGRDTLFFAQNGFEIYALDYSESGLKDILRKARALGLAKLVSAIRHDVRNRLPFNDETFDACYSHMLYCMALTTAELESLSEEIRRVLKPGGLNIYTVRHTNDPDYKTGIHRGEDMYEVRGFIVHFFSKGKVAHLAKGYEIVSVDQFEEGRLPRELFRVTLRKKAKSSDAKTP
ncbi:MAG: class I SAM-dependent methyltransferase [Deltaproteobacteria bacterium]|nr:class I SAM-dependent methyltransferase [Deltaproteobacteria bacterium]